MGVSSQRQVKELPDLGVITYKPIRAMRELVMSDLYEFVKYFWDTFEPFPFVDETYIEFLCECFVFMSVNKLPESLTSKFISDAEYEKAKIKYFKKTGIMPKCDVRDKMFRGEHVRNHNINIHPRAGKSLIVNVCGPVWCMMHQPVMTTSVSHSQDLSREFIDKKRLLLNSEKFRMMFPEEEYRLRYDSSTLVEMQNLGKSYSTSMKSFTGRGSNFILNDDLVNVQDARADGKVLQSAKDYIRYTQSTRLNDPKTGVTCHIMQRICKGDVSDMITSDPELSRLYSNTVLKALATEDEAFIFPLSGKIWFRKKGDPLAGKRFGDYSVERMKLGEIDFECQFQQNVALSGLNVVSLEDIKAATITQEDFAAVNKITHYASHDCPVKDLETSDQHGYVEGWSDEFSTLYITDAMMERMSISKEQEFLINLEAIDPSIFQVVEDKANGSPLLQMLAGTVAGLIPFQPGTRSKMARLELAVVYLRQGRVKFVKSERVSELCRHLMSFPTVANDDDVDAFTQLVITHFMQKNMFIYSGVFTSQNIIQKPHDTEYWNHYFGVTESGGMYYALKIRHDQTKDIFTVIEEHKFPSVAELADFLKQIEPGTIIYDCSTNQQIINLTQFVFGMYEFEDDNILVSTSIIKGGFAKNKIQVLQECTTTVLDIMRWRSPNKEFKNIPTDYDITTERVARCVRGVVTMVKGKSNFWL